MKRFAPVSLAFALALTGCGDNVLVDPDDGGGNDDPGEMPEPTMDATGLYRLHSTFDIAATMPPSFVGGLIAATDDPDDPASWLIDQMLAQMPDSAFKTLLQGAKPFVAGYLNDKLHDLAPELVDTLTRIGKHTAEMMKHFGVNERLAISASDQTLISTVTADGARFKIDNNMFDLAFVDHNIDDVLVDSVLVTIESEARMRIHEHSMPLPYGKIVRMGFDAAVIPTVDPTATSLVDVLDNAVDCQGVGTSISDALDFGSSAFWASVCTGGLTHAADMVYDQIVAADSKLTFHITGDARVSDSNMDYKLDKLQFGTWAGSLTYDTTDATLAQPATFDGARM